MRTQDFFVFRFMRPRLSAALALVVCLVLIAALAGHTQGRCADTQSVPGQATDRKSTQFALMADRFDAEEPARVLADQLRRKGLSPYLFETQAANGSAMFVVRLDIYDTLLDALKARERLAQSTKLALSVAPGGSAEPIAPEAMTFFVQIGVYDDPVAARHALAALVERGLDAGGLIPLHEPGAPPRIVVHAGTHPNYAATVKAASLLSKRGKLDASANVMDTALYVTRQTPARVAVPEAFAKPDSAANATGTTSATTPTSATKSASTTSATKSASSPAPANATAPTAAPANSENSTAANATAAKPVAPKAPAPASKPAASQDKPKSDATTTAPAPSSQPASPSAPAPTPPPAPAQPKEKPLQLLPVPPDAFPPPERPAPQN